MRRYGASEAQIKQYRNDNAPDDFYLLEEHADAMRWFGSVDDLFRVENGVILGLDITAIHNDLTLRGLQHQPETYRKLRHIGRIAANELNKRREQ